MNADKVYPKQFEERGSRAHYYPEIEVHVGDVGFYQRTNGKWYRLFNCLVASDHVLNSEGVPAGFTPFSLRPKHIEFNDESLLPQPIVSKSVVEVDVALNASGSPAVNVGAGMTYKCREEQGAVLLFGSRMARGELCDDRFIRNYMLTHVDSWYDFALECGFGPEQIPEGSIVLIRGCDKAPSFALAAFWKQKKEASISFQGGFVKGGDIRLDLQGTWEKSDSAEYRSGSPRPSAEDQAHTVPPTDEHGRPKFPFFAPDCVYTLFTRIYKIKRKRLGMRIPTKIVAAAGPHRLPRGDFDKDASPATPSDDDDDDCESSSGLDSDSGFEIDLDQSTDYGDHPLDEVVDYILDTRPDVKVAIATENDLKTDDFAAFGLHEHSPKDEVRRSAVGGVRTSANTTKSNYQDGGHKGLMTITITNSDQESPEQTPSLTILDESLRCPLVLAVQGTRGAQRNNIHSETSVQLPSWNETASLLSEPEELSTKIRAQKRWTCKLPLQYTPNQAPVRYLNPQGFDQSTSETHLDDDYCATLCQCMSCGLAARSGYLETSLRLWPERCHHVELSDLSGSYERYANDLWDSVRDKPALEKAQIPSYLPIRAAVHGYVVHGDLHWATGTTIPLSTTTHALATCNIRSGPGKREFGARLSGDYQAISHHLRINHGIQQVKLTRTRPTGASLITCLDVVLDDGSRRLFSDFGQPDETPVSPWPRLLERVASFPAYPACSADPHQSYGTTFPPFPEVPQTTAPFLSFPSLDRSSTFSEAISPLPSTSDWDSTSCYGIAEATAANITCPFCLETFTIAPQDPDTSPFRQHLMGHALPTSSRCQDRWSCILPDCQCQSQARNKLDSALCPTPEFLDNKDLSLIRGLSATGHKRRKTRICVLGVILRRPCGECPTTPSEIGTGSLPPSICRRWSMFIDHGGLVKLCKLHEKTRSELDREAREGGSCLELICAHCILEWFTEDHVRTLFAMSNFEY